MCTRVIELSVWAALSSAVVANVLPWIPVNQSGLRSVVQSGSERFAMDPWAALSSAKW